MGILSILGKGIKAMVEEATTPQSFKDGQKFEDYVREFIFTKNNFDLIEKTHDYKTNSEDYVKASLNPDFKFRDKVTKKEFYVEAKFRSSLFDGKIVWCNNNQLNRYKECNKSAPVFIIIGLGDDPSSPEAIALLPIQAAKYTGLFPNYAKEYKIKTDTSITSTILWDRK